MHEKRAADGNATEEWLSRPRVFPDLRDAWEAWQILSPRRRWNSGMAASPLPLSVDEIDTYARRFGPYDKEGFDELFHLLTSLDVVYLQHVNEQLKRDKKDNKHNE